MRWMGGLLMLWACGSDDGGEGPTTPTTAEGCPGMCVDAGFADGNEADYGGEVIECQCTGGSGELDLGTCETYCEGFGVAASNTYLSSEVTTNDKCVCDGTQG